MATALPTTMRAAAINQFGGLEEIQLRDVPVPEIGSNEVLIHVEFAGVGAWDPVEREGGFVELTGQTPSFPHVLGSEGAGTIAAVGSQVSQFKVGDKVYAAAFLNPKGGFYAEYAVVDINHVSHIPGKLTVEQAAVMGGDAVTALRGLTDHLGLKAGESVMIIGAGGGIGHLSVQIAKRLNAKVFAVASGADGVTLARQLGADAVVDGRKEDVVAAARAFAPGGLDAALCTAGGEAIDKALTTLRDGGRVAFPTGVEPEPNVRSNVKLIRYDGDAEGDVIQRLNQLIEAGPFEVHVARSFPLDQVADAQEALNSHYLGKLAIRVT